MPDLQLVRPGIKAHVGMDITVPELYPIKDSKEFTDLSFLRAENGFIVNEVPEDVRGTEV